MNTIGHRCTSTWAEVLESTRVTIGQDDYESVQRFQSPEQLIAAVQELQENSARSTIARLLRNLLPHLVHIQTLATFIAVAIGSDGISLACLWGLIYLLIQLGSRSDETLRGIARYLDELSAQIELFEVYQKSLEPDHELLARFFELLVELVIASAKAIRSFRKNGINLNSWKHVDQEFAQSLENFTVRIEHLRKLVQAHQLTGMNLKQHEVAQTLSKYSSPLNSQREASGLPYYQLPFTRNPAFYGRARVLQSIQAALGNEQTDRGLHSVALWGTGGIGKSQVALEFANLRIQQKCQLVLWIPAQSETELSRALVQAANEVRPPGFEENMTADRSRFLMWNWLQTTAIPWLIIFDNVDDNELLYYNWPAAGNGQILVTCRSELIAATPAATAIEIPPFNPVEGGELLLKLAHKRDVDKDDFAAAEELSSMLGGLALAIDITARQIFVKKKSMKLFLPYFKEHKLSMRVPPRYSPRNHYYNDTLLTVWQTAFESLDENSHLLLGLICFFAPDNIPRDLIHTPGPAIPGAWQFLTGIEEYEEAEAQLLRTSLIKINDEAGMLSLHRLVQEAYYYHLSEEKRKSAFSVAYRLLCEAFPKRTLRRQMYEVWPLCELLTPHIDALSDMYEGLKKSGYDVQDPVLYTMLADATWYCSETCALQVGHKLGRRAAENFADKTSLLSAYLCESIATIDHRAGRYRDAHTFFLKSLSIREADPTTTGPELADAHSAIGLALFGLFESEAAIEAVNKALKIAWAAPVELQHTYNIDRYLRNRSRPHAALLKFENAKRDVALAEEFQTKIYGPDGHFHGETAYISGKIAVQEGHLDLADKYLQRAYDLQSPGKPTHQSVASAFYHQARVCLLRNDDREQRDQQALDYLRQALIITQFNESRRGDQGESARVKYQISMIWNRQGRTADAMTYRTSALKTKADLERTGLYPQAPDEEQAWDCFSDLVDR